MCILQTPSPVLLGLGHDRQGIDVQCCGCLLLILCLDLLLDSLLSGNPHHLEQTNGLPLFIKPLVLERGNITLTLVPLSNNSFIVWPLRLPPKSMFESACMIQTSLSVNWWGMSSLTSSLESARHTKRQTASAACPHTGTGESQTIMHTHNGSPWDPAWIGLPSDTEIPFSACAPRRRTERARIFPLFGAGRAAQSHLVPIGHLVNLAKPFRSN